MLLPLLLLLINFASVRRLCTAYFDVIIRFNRKTWFLLVNQFTAAVGNEFANDAEIINESEDCYDSK